MKTKDFAFLLGVGLIPCCTQAEVGLSTSASSSNREQKPNVIFFLVDDMGWADCEPYGSTYYETPNIRRLAGEGMLFTNAYMAAPLSSASRSSIMSGQYPARLHLTTAITKKDVPEPKALPPQPGKICGLVESRCHMPLEIHTLGEAFQEAGYQTAHIGKWHLCTVNEPEYEAQNRGFDFVIGGNHFPGPPSYYPPYKSAIPNLPPEEGDTFLNERLARESVKWIDSIKDNGKPFYLNFWQYAVHGPIEPKLDLLPKYQAKHDPKGLQKCPEMGTLIESMDTALGILLDYLDRPENTELKKNTVIVFTSDNGGVTHTEVQGRQVTSNRPLRAGKASTYEGGIRVPLIVTWPGVVKAGSHCEHPVQSIDFYPTLMEIVGSSVPETAQRMDGFSICPLLRGETMPDRPIFTHFPHLFGILCAPSTSVRYGDYKLIRYYWAGKNAQSHHYELYNLKEDWFESINLASYMPEKVADLDRMIDAFLEDTDALIPSPNPDYTGTYSKVTRAAKKKGIRPTRIELNTKNFRAEGTGQKTICLLNQLGEQIHTNAIVLEGSEWVTVTRQVDENGKSVRISWDTSKKQGSARILFGWRGGTTISDINDWTLNPVELRLE